MAATPPSSPSKGNVLTRKIGPLATWLWVVIILIPIVIYSVIERKKAGASTTASTATTSGTPASDVPQFVNQTYTTVQAPTAPNSTGTVPVHHHPIPTTGTTSSPPSAAPPPASTAPPAASTPTPAPSTPAQPAPVTEPVPSVVGERVNFAIGKLQSLGLGYSSASGSRNPKSTYVVTGQNPAAGTQVPAGSKVTLTWKVGT